MLPGLTTPTLRRLSVTSFRNLAEQSIPLGPGVTLLLGRNGQGKTNLLEAIALLASGRSFRGATTAEMIANGAGSLRVVAEIEEAHGLLTLAVELAERPSRSRRFLVGGKNLPASGWLGLVPAIAVTAERMEIVRGGSEDRRRYLDRGILLADPSAAELYRTVERLLRQRGSLLAGSQPARRKREQIAAWNVPLAEAASRLRAARRRYAEAVAEETARIFTALGRTGNLLLEYRPSPEGDDSAAELLAAFERAADGEIAAGRTRLGPGRDDLLVTLDGYPAKSHASAGEQKAIVLALKLAKLGEARRSGKTPLLLLDDLDAELDAGVLARFLRLLPAGHQIVATSAKPEWLEPLTGAGVVRLSIEGGHVGETSGSRLRVAESS